MQSRASVFLTVLDSDGGIGETHSVDVFYRIVELVAEALVVPAVVADVAMEVQGVVRSVLVLNIYALKIHTVVVVPS